MEMWLSWAIALASGIGCLAGAAVLLLLLSLLGVITWPISVLAGVLCLVASGGFAVHSFRRRRAEPRLLYSSIEVAVAARVLPSLLSATGTLEQADQSGALAGKAIMAPLASLSNAQAAELLSDMCIHLERDHRIGLETALQNEGWGISYLVLRERGDATCRFHLPDGDAFGVKCDWFRGQEWEDHVARVHAHFPYHRIDLLSTLRETTEDGSLQASRHSLRQEPGR